MGMAISMGPQALSNWLAGCPGKACQTRPGLGQKKAMALQGRLGYVTGRLAISKYKFVLGLLSFQSLSAHEPALIQPKSRLSPEEG